MTRTSIALTIAVSMAAQTVVANDFSNVRSGLLLGIYANPSQGGMKVSSTIPGYSAEGRLFRGDVLMRATIDGWQMHNLRSHHEMENAKMAIGAGREAAVEIWRPGQGMIYAWVEFTPIFAPAAAAGAPQVRMQTRAKARFSMESEKPGARQLFQRGDRNNKVQPRVTPPTPMPRVPNSGSKRSAAKLFNR